MVCTLLARVTPWPAFVRTMRGLMFRAPIRARFATRARPISVSMAVAAETHVPLVSSLLARVTPWPAFVRTMRGLMLIAPIQARSVTRARPISVSMAVAAAALVKASSRRVVLSTRIAILPATRRHVSIRAQMPWSVQKERLRSGRVLKLARMPAMIRPNRFM